MKFVEIKEAYGANYAVFELESTKEKNFFDHLSPIKQQSIFSNLPESLRTWMIESRPPAVVGEKNSIMIIFSSPYSYNFFSKSQTKPIFDLLDYLVKNEILETDPTEPLKNASDSSSDEFKLEAY